MTAIYGLWNFDGSNSRSGLDRLNASLAKYGSDAANYSVFEAVGIGHRLRRLLPEDKFDHQPVEAQASRYSVVADVRLTERSDLLDQLAVKNASQMSDAAIVGLAIERWHEGAFDRIYGSFAIGAWDKHERRFLLARDHVGERPLAYFHSREHFAFGSMPSALAAHGCVSGEADPEAVERFLALVPIAQDATFHRGVKRIRPGHWAEITQSGVAQTRYWKPNLEPLLLPTYEAYVAKLDQTFSGAVEAALRSDDAHIAAHLSSGLDSTAVAATAAVKLKESGKQVCALTSVPPAGLIVPEYVTSIVDEGELAALTVSVHENMDHVLVPPLRGPLERLDSTAEIFGEPAFNLCNQVWIDAIHDQVEKRGISVLLIAGSGNITISEEGDTVLPELFGALRWRDWIGVARRYNCAGTKRWRGILWQTFRPFLPSGLVFKIDKWVGRQVIEPDRCTPVSKARLAELSGAGSEEQSSDHPMDRPRNLSFSYPRSSLEERITGLSKDHGFYWKGILGEWDIDCREPTSDRRLIELSLRIPISLQSHQGGSRMLIRDVITDRAPPEICENTITAMQGIAWFDQLTASRSQLLEEIEHIESFGNSASMVDLDRLKQLAADWPDSHSAHTIETTADYRISVLRAISASKFMRRASRCNY